MTEASEVHERTIKEYLLFGLKKKKVSPGGTPFPKANDIPWYSPRPWHGMTFSVWAKVLRQNRVSLASLPMATIISFVSILNSFGRWRSESLHGDGADASQFEHEPLFVLGHFRTGTTFLHELLTQDPQFSFPTTYQCMSPHHYLWSERFVPKLSAMLLPERRMMDNMDFNWDLPQEDEWALCNMGLPTPYLFWAFPDQRDESTKAYSLDEYSDADRQEWAEGLRWFLKRLNYRDPRQLVLKSPTHTARVALILKIFPNAKFIHLVRNPISIIPSTVRTLRQMGKACEFYPSRDKRLEDLAYTNFNEMYRAYWRDEHLFKKGQVSLLRYEDMMAAPIEELNRIYAELSLDGFENARRHFEAQLARKKNYRKNRFDMKDDFRTRILENCHNYADRYGYAAETKPSPSIEMTTTQAKNAG